MYFTPFIFTQASSSLLHGLLVILFRRVRIRGRDGVGILFTGSYFLMELGSRFWTLGLMVHSNDWLNLTRIALYVMSWTVVPFYFYFACWHTPAHLLYSLKNTFRTHPLHKRWYISLAVVIFWLYASTDIIFMSFYYGKWAALLSPGRNWFLIWIAYHLCTIWSRGPYSKIESENESDSNPFQEDDTEPRSPIEQTGRGYNLRSRGSH